MPDGKLRARQMHLLSRPGGGRDSDRRGDGRRGNDRRGEHDRRGDDRHGDDRGGEDSGGAGSRRCTGKILKYDEGKGYGFIASSEIADNIFFLRSTLPLDIREASFEELKELNVSFELYSNEAGKPRANRVKVIQDRPSTNAVVQSGEVCTGVIVRFDPPKNYGFARPDTIAEDVFFQRSEMPPEIREADKKEDVVDQRVEFEIQTMPDGKMRALGMTLIAGSPRERSRSRDRVERGGHGRARSGERNDVPLAPLEDALVEEMTEFLAQSPDGSCDFGKFSSTFARVKKKQVEAHFTIINLGGGKQRVELPEGHPARPVADPVSPLAAEDVGVPMEPAIPVGPGCQPLGKIRTYDALKGFGFICSDGLEEEVFFPRIALPVDFRAKQQSEMPDLVGVLVSFELNPSSDRGPRADNVTLLLKWHVDDRCWLLNRNSDVDV